MADYKGIKGFKVQYLSADPSNPIIGQTWYNDTSKDLKYTGVLLQVLGQLVIIYHLLIRFGCWNSNSRISFWWFCSSCYSSNRRI
jgi:hypothetical protein